MKIKIESDGTPQGTKVFNEDTGEEIENVLDVQWWFEQDAHITLANLKIHSVPVTLGAELRTRQDTWR